MYQSVEGTSTPHGMLDAPTPKSKLAKIGAIVGGLALAAGACWYGIGYNRNETKLLTNLDVPYPWEVAAPEPVTTYLDWEIEDAPVKERKPSKYAKYNVDLFSHPVVQEALENADAKTQNICSGPSGNIDVWYNEAAVQKDLQSNEGYTVFDLDCRDTNADPLIAFIVVLDMQGNIAAIHQPPIRAESVNMFSTDVVMFSTIAGSGVFLWNWKEDTVQKLPFPADAHTMQYRHSEKKFYGLYLDEEGMTKFSPSVAVSFDAETGEYGWAYEPEFSHINYLTVSDKYAFLSLRSGGCLQKVDMETNEVLWNLGGKYSNFHMYDRDGNFLDANKKLRNTFRESVDENLFGSFQHQHKFQHLTDNYFSLFDNNLCSQTRFCNSDSSRMVVVRLDEDMYMSSELFSWETGDQSMIYGGADVLPSGNILGNSYHKAVYPTDDEYKYHVNIWEVQPDGEIAWRVGIQGLNPWNPEDLENRYLHSKGPQGEAPTGWMIYNVDRFYSKPVVSKPCTTEVDGETVIRLLPHNTIRTQEDMPGIAYLYDKADKKLLSKTYFDFQKSWIPRALDVTVPMENQLSDLSLLVVNSWQEGTMIDIGLVDTLNSCDAVEMAELRLIK